MAANMWQVYSAAVPTTAAMVRVATGTALKTHLQVTAPSNADLTIISWGVALESTPAAFVVAELINTTTVAGGSPTAVTPSNVRGNTAFAGTAGFAPSSEGTVVATTRVFDTSIMTSSYFDHEWSLGREPILEASQVLRIRLTTATTVNALCWILFE